MGSHWALLLALLAGLALARAHAPPPPAAAPCNASAFSIPLNHTQCFGLTLAPNIPTYAAC